MQKKFFCFCISLYLSIVGRLELFYFLCSEFHFLTHSYKEHTNKKKKPTYTHIHRKRERILFPAVTVIVLFGGQQRATLVQCLCYDLLYEFYLTHQNIELANQAVNRNNTPQKKGFIDSESQFQFCLLSVVLSEHSPRREKKRVYIKKNSELKKEKLTHN